MLGDRVGILAVYAEFNDNKRKQLWKKSGDKGNEWFQAQITLQEENQFKVFSLF